MSKSQDHAARMYDFQASNKYVEKKNLAVTVRPGAPVGTESQPWATTATKRSNHAVEMTCLAYMSVLG